MNILYYFWNENSSNDIKSLFHEFGYFYTEISYQIRNYDSEPELEKFLHKTILSQHFDAIFTFDYFPLLSKVAQLNRIPYISWIYDCPHWTLYSATITNPCNYLFLFDSETLETVVSLGAVHAFHLPLAVNTKHLNAKLSLPHQSINHAYIYDLSFVGSLYETNSYQQIKYLPDHLRGYLDGIMNAQQKIWGSSILDSVLPENILNQLLSYVTLEENPNYSFSSKDIILDMLESNITYMERKKLLQKVSQQFHTHIFSGSNLSCIPECIPHNPISYTEEMPDVFFRSKINLNISLRSIHQGIPLRCLDIMGSGGFLLSNYQPELADCFTAGEEFIYFESEEDLLIKANYFLSHDSERKEIAQNGWDKIQKQYSYPVQFQKIIKQVPL